LLFLCIDSGTAPGATVYIDLRGTNVPASIRDAIKCPTCKDGKVEIYF
jgi:hypothetical protein